MKQFNCSNGSKSLGFLLNNFETSGSRFLRFLVHNQTDRNNTHATQRTHGAANRHKRPERGANARVETARRANTTQLPLVARVQRQQRTQRCAAIDRLVDEIVLTGGVRVEHAHLRALNRIDVAAKQQFVGAFAERQHAALRCAAAVDFALRWRVPNIDVQHL
jgi:hypothetical protein